MVENTAGGFTRRPERVRFVDEPAVIWIDVEMTPGLIGRPSPIVEFSRDRRFRGRLRLLPLGLGGGRSEGVSSDLSFLFLLLLRPCGSVLLLTTNLDLDAALEWEIDLCDVGMTKSASSSSSAAVPKALLRPLEPFATTETSEFPSASDFRDILDGGMFFQVTTSTWLQIKASKIK